MRSSCLIAPCLLGLAIFVIVPGSPAAFAADVSAPTKPSLYGNARYNYTVAYPAELLIALPEADNGDGRVFKARNGSAKIRVYAEYNAMESSPAALADQAADKCPDHHPSYRVAKATLVAVSCETANGIFYHKTLIKDDLLVTLEANYSKSEKDRWDPVIAQMARSLTANK